eukprot:m51a1_g11973 putative d-3-phosphoglycerate dehydrogenase (558) ;mRNA; r:835961-838022
MRARVLVADNIDKQGLAILRRGADVDVKTGMTPAQLAQAIGPYDALVIRSASRVTKEVIDAARALRVIARAGVGVDNVDVEAATAKGIIVVNSPGGNTVAAAEHTLSMMMSLARHIPVADKLMKDGKWDRKLIGVQLFKKTLGIIGLGRVGLHVATVARAAGMTLIGFDPYLTPERAKMISGVQFVPLDELVAKADFITLHVPKTPQTENLINEAQLGRMKPTARIINCSRGGVINEAALAAALKAGRIAGAALDVFDEEPLSDKSPLRTVTDGRRLVMTPHLGASTAEAQVNVAVDVAEQVVDILKGLPPRAAVNLPGIRPEVIEKTMPWMLVAESLGQLLAQLFSQPMQSLSVVVRGPAAKDAEMRLVVSSAIKGALFRSVASEERVTYVNASMQARRRGVYVSETRSEDGHAEIELIGKSPVGPSLVEEHSCSATHDGLDVWINNIDGFRMQVPATQRMLIHHHVDAPGVIGRMGTVLGGHDINISSMQVGRKGVRGEAVTVLNVDNVVPQAVADEMRKMPNVRSLAYIELTANGIPSSPSPAPAPKSALAPKL